MVSWNGVFSESKTVGYCCFKTGWEVVGAGVDFNILEMIRLKFSFFI